MPRGYGSGLAKSIREKWPEVYKHYTCKCKIYQYDFQRLGLSQLVKIDEGLGVLNIFGQLNYGNDGKRYTDYGALKQAFFDIAISNGYPIGKEPIYYFPFNFGCDRGGADWAIVSKMIDFYFPNAITCKLPK